MYTGVFHEVEKCIPAYDLINTDYQIIHTTRGCIRNCDFCGVYRIEPIFTYKKSIKKEILKKKVIFYDNNFLANPYVENILLELIKLRKNKKITYLESQSGFDGRLLEDNPHLAKLIHDAGFKNVRIAWDHELEDALHIHKQIKILENAGYIRSSISVFMIYNNELPYYILEQKRAKCFEYGVQVMDCRNRPLHITSDGYNPHKRSQSRNEYYIHEKWTDKEVRQFRRNVRRHNIAIRFRTKWYSKTVERKKLDKTEKKELFKLSYDEVKPLLQDAWNPKEPYLMEGNKWKKKKT